MTTEEEKNLTELLKENLDNEDLFALDSSEKYEKPVSHSHLHKNRRWRQLNLKIKIFAGVLLLGAGITAGSLYYNTQHSDTEISISAEDQHVSSKSPLESRKGTGIQGSDKNKDELPETTITPAISLTPTPVPVTPTPEPPSVPDTWNMILVNPWNPLPDDFTVELKNVENGHAVDARIAIYLEKMLSDARAQGLSPMICSSYRTYEKQQTLYTNKVNYYLNQGYSQKDAESEAGKWVAVPGTSEHQTGLAVDLVSSSYQVLDQKQEETPEQKWLMENSYKYGFILRYPNEKRAITGIYYEPWHYRYVGHKTAKEIYEKGICYEEYLESLKKAPA